MKRLGNFISRLSQIRLMCTHKSGGVLPEKCHAKRFSSGQFPNAWFRSLLRYKRKPASILKLIHSSFFNAEFFHQSIYCINILLFEWAHQIYHFLFSKKKCVRNWNLMYVFKRMNELLHSNIIFGGFFTNFAATINSFNGVLYGTFNC